MKKIATKCSVRESTANAIVLLGTMLKDLLHSHLHHMLYHFGHVIPNCEFQLTVQVIV